MTELELLRGLRDDVAPARRSALDQGRAQLLNAMTAPAQAVPRTPAPRFRLRWRIATAAALALVATAIAAPAVIGGRGADNPDITRTDAVFVLTAAATAADAQQPVPERPDQYVYVASTGTVHGETFACEPAARTACTTVPDPDMRIERQIWGSVDGTRDGLLRTRADGAQGWDEFALESPGPRAYLDNLPTDPQAMLAHLRGTVSGKDRKYSAAGMQEFSRARDLLGENYLPPASLAALYQALATVPGITVTQDVTDAADRLGVAVGIDVPTARIELIFEPDSYTYLGSRVLNPDGTIDQETAQLRIAIVDRVGQQP
ncbi:CU044_5270 family protein [Catellatospora paridis]|uniref:CU044_5270 family protein n=1 Tax=Catellatospora paridis TaxID=1617086 RepID=UPI0012D38F07|nr:CU044_5270 family protein [Catellatospora paridis]